MLTKEDLDRIASLDLSTMTEEQQATVAWLVSLVKRLHATNEMVYRRDALLRGLVKELL